MYSENSYSYHEAISSFVCNGQSVVGYSVCVSGLAGVLLSIHAHETWQDTSMYDTEPDDDSTWLIMPMDDGEVLTDIWEGMAPDRYIWSIRDEDKQEPNLPYRRCLAPADPSLRPRYLDTG
ncbi:hypothetical protein LCI18_002693 [Fusarium solani-melongenae]|uniref:Uncharacterized protein n=1 Tax=Fusarium solani subsp. cucurbitae TaxID=2747967 RepID=A0ACD3YV75_FUSSC|nr:hypothetical protein LCI18_002693 [Fusarium solani-melongenae]